MQGHARVWLLVLLGALAIQGCSDSPVEPYPDAAITGVITSVVESNEAPGGVLIEEDPALELSESNPGDPGGGKLWFALDSETEILVRRQGGQTAPGDPSLLMVGTRVAAWSTGYYLDSYPGQTQAVKIVVLE